MRPTGPHGQVELLQDCGTHAKASTLIEESSGLLNERRKA
jgi:hypothetical protein